VFYVSGLSKNLLSIGSLIDKGIIACFDDGKCVLYSRGNKRIIVEGLLRNRKNGLYQLSALNLDITANLAQTEVNAARLWHHRLGHIGYDRLHDLTARNMVTGIPYIPKYNEVCSQCQVGKQTREGFLQHSTSRASEPLQLLHIDLCGPFPIPSQGGSEYFLVIVDDYSRYIWVRFLRHKSNAFAKFKVFKTMIELQLGRRIKTVGSDRGGKFLSLEFSKLCEEAGIIRQLTTAHMHTLEHNGVAERSNRKLLEMESSMSTFAVTPRSL